MIQKRRNCAQLPSPPGTRPRDAFGRRCGLRWLVQDLRDHDDNDRDDHGWRHDERQDRSRSTGGIKSKGTLTVAADATYAPNEFIGANGQTVMGMDPTSPRHWSP